MAVQKYRNIERIVDNRKNLLVNVFWNNQMVKCSLEYPLDARYCTQDI